MLWELCLPGSIICVILCLVLFSTQLLMILLAFSKFFTKFTSFVSDPYDFLATLRKSFRILKPACKYSLLAISRFALLELCEQDGTL